VACKVVTLTNDGARGPRGSERESDGIHTAI
jgi:hypothetical protein